MARSCAIRRGFFEALEHRQLLAGDVVLNVVNGNLMIQGDALDNKIVVTAGTEAGSFVVTGLDGTTVHQDGEPATTDPVTVTGVKSIRADLGEGNDLIAVVGANVRGSLGIRTGAGDDRVLVGTGGDAAELVGQLPDDVSVGIRGAVAIGTDGGNDEVSVDNAMIGGHLGVHAGIDNDTVSLGAATDDDLSARVRARGVHVDLGAGNDELNMHQLNARGGIVAHGGLGDDTMDASRIHAAALVALTDGGVDAVTMGELRVHHLGVHTGEGNDNVDIRDSMFAAFGVSLGAGDDTLTTSALTARIGVMLGGPGEDTFEAVSDNNIAHEVIHGFEIPPDINTNGLPFGRRPLARLLSRLR